jgi:uncharacterized Zn finger protein (UPF0148 family)
MIRFTCAKCGKPLKAPPDKSGALARCPGCGSKTPIPPSDAGPARTPPAEEAADPNVELVDDAPEPAPEREQRGANPSVPAARKRAKKKARPSSPATGPYRFLRPVLWVVMIPLVLLVFVWAGMAWQGNAPRTWGEFWNRLRQEPTPDKQPEKSAPPDQGNGPRTSQT